jgi:V8-like Glu-specific endopeptidase
LTYHGPSDIPELVDSHAVRPHAARRWVLPTAGLAVAAALLVSFPAPTPPGFDATAAARAETFEGNRPRIVNGVFTVDHPAVGALLEVANPADPDGSRSGLRCSGTMIGCRTFLTAAHCVCDGRGSDCQEGGTDLTDASGLLVFLQGAGFFAVERIEVHPDYEFEVRSDLAIIELAEPVVGIAPAPINTTAKPAPGTTGTIVGFGRSGGNPGTNADSGLKRAGEVSIAACTTVPNAAHVCWVFANPIGEPGTDSNTCEGDSGGPLFVERGGVEVVAGVTSGGETATCLPTDLSFDADVFANRAWIQNTGGSDIENASCGPLPQVGQPGTVTHAGLGSLGAQQASATFTVTVPAGAPLLRVALNADESGGGDFDLYVKAGSPPTPSDFDCRSERNSQFEFCEIGEPAPGTWHILVQRFSGSGVFQVTTTVFSSGAPLPTPTPTATPAPRAQSKDQQKCINAMNSAGTKVAATQGRANVACVKDAGKGKVSDVQSCLSADPKGKLAKATSKTAEEERKQCKTLPDFGFAGTGDVNDGSVGESLALFADVFGNDPNGAVVPCSQNAPACQCQAAVAKDYEKILAVKLKEFLKCKKAALKGGATSGAALASCVTPGGIAADSRGRIEKQIGKLAANIGKKCTANVFPGRCSRGDLTTLHACIDHRVECRVCRMINAMDALAVDCDLFDDGFPNGSCGGGSSPSPTPTVAPGQIACSQTVAADLSPEDPDFFLDGTLADLYVFILTQTTTVQFDLTASGFEPFVWIGAVDSQNPIFSGPPPQGGQLTAGTYNVIANNLVPVAPDVYPYELTMSCGGG